VNSTTQAARYSIASGKKNRGKPPAVEDSCRRNKRGEADNCSSFLISGGEEETSRLRERFVQHDCRREIASTVMVVDGDRESAHHEKRKTEGRDERQSPNTSASMRTKLCTKGGEREGRRGVACNARKRGGRTTSVVSAGRTHKLTIRISSRQWEEKKKKRENVAAKCSRKKEKKKRGGRSASLA